MYTSYTGLTLSLTFGWSGCATGINDHCITYSIEFIVSPFCCTEQFQIRRDRYGLGVNSWGSGVRQWTGFILGVWRFEEKLLQNDNLKRPVCEPPQVIQYSIRVGWVGLMRWGKCMTVWVKDELRITVNTSVPVTNWIIRVQILTIVSVSGKYMQVQNLRGKRGPWYYQHIRGYWFPQTASHHRSPEQRSHVSWNTSEEPITSKLPTMLPFLTATTTLAWPVGQRGWAWLCWHTQK